MLLDELTQGLVKTFAKPLGVLKPADLTSGFFSSVKTKAAFTLGSLSASAAVCVVLMASVSMVHLSPVALGLVVGLLAAVAVPTLAYTAARVQQNMERFDPVFT